MSLKANARPKKRTTIALPDTVEVEEQFRRDPAFSQRVVAKAIELFERRIEG